MIFPGGEGDQSKSHKNPTITENYAVSRMEYHILYMYICTGADSDWEQIIFVLIYVDEVVATRADAEQHQVFLKPISSQQK